MPIHWHTFLFLYVFFLLKYANTLAYFFVFVRFLFIIIIIFPNFSFVTPYLQKRLSYTPEIFTDDSSWKDLVRDLLWVTLTLGQGHQVH
jgi:hypothetical protein